MAKKKAIQKARIICVSMPPRFESELKKRIAALGMGRSEYFRWLVRRDTEVQP